LVRPDGRPRPHRRPRAGRGAPRGRRAHHRDRAVIERAVERLRTERPVQGVVVAVLAYSLLYWVPGSPLPDRMPWGVVAQGVIFGTSYALLAMGLILIYRTTRIVNFAYGAMGAMPGSLTVGLFMAKGW